MKFIFVISVSLLMISCDGGSDSSSPAAPATVSVKNNQTISGYSHTIDYYIPSNAQYAIIFLHGGGGKKEGVANSLGIKNDSTNANYDVSVSGSDWLINNKVMLVFPQGQHVTGVPLATTWNNYVMTSGVDDVSFLQNLVSAIQADSSLPHVTKFYLAGHSNGGMMVNRMWCESPNTFAAYGALAGPPSSQLDSSGTHPCSPSTIKPYIGIVGNADTQLQTTGNMGATAWTIRNYNGASPAWVASTVLNDLLYFSNRVTVKCGGSVSGPVVSGQISTYTGCSNTLKEIIISQATISGNPSGGDHCLADVSGGCVTNLNGVTGLDYKTELFNFFKSF